MTDAKEQVGKILNIKDRKTALIVLMILSSGSDILFTTLGWTFALPSAFGSLAAEELVEYVISNLAAKHVLGKDLSMFDKAAGFIPIPGVTALSIKCYKELKKEMAKEQTT